MRTLLRIKIADCSTSPATVAGGGGGCSDAPPGFGELPVVDALFLIAILCIAKDWLLSPRDPYPYAIVATVTIPGILAYVAYPWLSIERRSNTALILILAAVMFVATAASPIVLPVAAFVYAALRVASRAGCRATVVWAYVAAGALFVVGLAVHAGLFDVRAGELSDPWLGCGIGVSSSVAPIAISIADNLGVPALASIVACLLAIVALGMRVALRPAAGGETIPGVARLAVALLLGTVASAVIAPHVSSVTGIFAVNIALVIACTTIMSAARSVPKISRKDTLRVKRHRLRMFVVTAAVVLLTLLWGDGVTLRLVAPFASGAWGLAPGRASLASISHSMQDATIAMEDHAFYRHHGFDWIAMHHALRLDLREGQIKEGGSTITQQLAKNLFLTNDRTVWRKIEEAAYTWELERMLPKSRILELYLNTIDYGMGQHGITAAARYYFHKTPDKLTLAESAILVGIVPDPMHEQVDPQRLIEGRQTALSRVRYFFPHRYSQEECDLASWYPLNLIIYPDKDAWDRGATCQIPADWHGVKFYFFANPDEPLPIDQVSLSLKNRLAGFLDDAHEHLHVVAIDHLGVYNDRSTRQEAKVISSHAYGQAIDISGFRFVDGSRVSVKDHDNPKVMARLAPLEAMLNRHFDAVVDWRDDPKRHQTHFHTEVKGPRPTMPRPVQDPPTKSVDETMAEIRGAKRLPPRIVTWLSGALAQQTSGTGNDELVRALKANGESVVSNIVSSDELLDQIERTGAPVTVVLRRPAEYWITVVGAWGDYFLIAEPQRGNVLMAKNEFYARFDGEVARAEGAKL